MNNINITHFRFSQLLNRVISILVKRHLNPVTVFVSPNIKDNDLDRLLMIAIVIHGICSSYKIINVIIDGK